MMDFNLIYADDIGCNEVYENLKSLTIGKRTLYLTATQSLKRLRMSNSYIYENFCNDKNQIITFAGLKESIYDSLKEEDRFISRADQKFILNQVIKSLFSGDRYRALYNMRSEIFELFDYLLSQEVFDLEENVIEQIGLDFTNFEKDIFIIYNKYFTVLNDIKSGVLPADIDLKRIKIGTPVKLLSDVVNSLLFKQVDDYDVIVFDGFLFFNDEQMKILDDALFKKKEIVFIAKNISTDKSNFLLDNLYFPLEKQYNKKLNVINVNSGSLEVTNALSFVKENYLDFAAKTDFQMDEGFKIYEPFTSRDREFGYIINFISSYAEKCCGDNRSKISRFLLNDVCIVIANNKDKYEQQLNVILKEKGVFFLDRKSDLLNQLDCENIKDIIYNRNSFIDSRVKYRTGKVLSLHEKMIAFKKLYKGINISQKSRSFINYPIGQYILEIYNIINNGMTVEGFKKILYSNWFNNINVDTQKYEKYINEFKCLEPFLRKKTTMLEWIEEFDKIKRLKLELAYKPEYKYHPINSITTDCLYFLADRVKDIKLIVDNLEGVIGDINTHFKALKDNFKIDDLLYRNDVDGTFEGEILQNIKDVINRINKSNLITNIDSKYFSDNIYNMLLDYEREKAESEADNLTLNVVNLENMQNFRYTFFCMCEEDKYPRPYNLSFPFSENILNILKDSKYGIECPPSFIKTLDYHINLEKYLFLNVLDFTKEQLIITQTEEENGKELTNSVYVEDIFSMFNKDIKYKVLKERETKVGEKYVPFENVEMDYKDDTPLKLSELCSYFLCPKIYYYQSNPLFKQEIAYKSEWLLNVYIPGIIYYKTLFKLGFEGQINKKIYNINTNELINDIRKYYDEVFEDEFKYFDYVMSFDKKDIRNKVQELLNGFVSRNIYNSKPKLERFSFHLSEPSVYKVMSSRNKFLTIKTDTTLNIFDEDIQLGVNYDIFSQIDFLVKSAGGNSHNLKHFAELLNRLNQRNQLDDRIGLTSYLFFKVNTQLSSIAFKKDGVQRLQVLSDFIKKQDDKNFIPSSYCKYCKFDEICKSKERGIL